jgi:hypothetical protein
MPARDIYHDAVVQALIADGWLMIETQSLLMLVFHPTEGRVARWIS